MHPAAVTNHHCIVYLGLGSPGVFFTTEYGAGIAFVCQKEHTVWVGTLGVWMGGTFPFFFLFRYPAAKSAVTTRYVTRYGRYLRYIYLDRGR